MEGTITEEEGVVITAAEAVVVVDITFHQEMIMNLKTTRNKRGRKLNPLLPEEIVLYAIDVV